jgi:hypothetical protein
LRHFCDDKVDLQKFWPLDPSVALIIVGEAGAVAAVDIDETKNFSRSPNLCHVALVWLATVTEIDFGRFCAPKDCQK